MHADVYHPHLVLNAGIIILHFILPTKLFGLQNSHMAFDKDLPVQRAQDGDGCFVNVLGDGINFAFRME